MAGKVEPKPRFKKLTEEQVIQALSVDRPNAITKEVNRLVEQLMAAYFPDYEAEAKRRGACPELSESLEGRWPIETVALSLMARQFNSARHELACLMAHWDSVHTAADLN